jgi:hypothetical protein
MPGMDGDSGIPGFYRNLTGISEVANLAGSLGSRDLWDLFDSGTEKKSTRDPSPGSQESFQKKIPEIPGFR